MPLNRRTIAIVEANDRALNNAEDQVIAQMRQNLDAAYNNLEAELLANYRQNAERFDLLPDQRSLLILGRLKNNIDLIDGKQANQLQRSLTNSLRRAGEDGAELARRLSSQIGNEELEAFDGIPIEALRFQAENSITRLRSHGQRFAQAASAIVGLNLATGQGPQAVASQLRQQLGIAKGRAESIARTELLHAHNQATLAAYARSNIQYFQLIATLDARTCPFCAARNMRVYERGQSEPPIHPRCRCYPAPFKPEWQQAGLTNDEFAEQFRNDAIAELRSNGREPNFGVSPFERMAGQSQAPEYIWSPGRAPIEIITSTPEPIPGPTPTPTPEPTPRPTVPAPRLSETEMVDVEGLLFREYTFNVDSDINVRLSINVDGHVTFTTRRTNAAPPVQTGLDEIDQLLGALDGEGLGFDTLDVTPNQAGAIGRRLFSIIRQDAKTRDDGFSYETSAWTSDGRGASRTLAYARVGFSRPVRGEPGGHQFGIVQNGRIQPDIDRLNARETEMNVDQERAEERFSSIRDQRKQEKQAREFRNG